MQVSDDATSRSDPGVSRPRHECVWWVEPSLLLQLTKTIHQMQNRAVVSKYVSVLVRQLGLSGCKHFASCGYLEEFTAATYSKLKKTFDAVVWRPEHTSYS